MLGAVRCKFVCTEIHRHHCNKGSAKVIFEPRYDDSIPEDQRFNKATPSGKIEMQIDNPSAVAFFELGKAYYFDATEVPAQAA